VLVSKKSAFQTRIDFYKYRIKIKFILRHGTNIINKPCGEDVPALITVSAVLLVNLFMKILDYNLKVETQNNVDSQGFHFVCD
jgi:hypothetical protein